MKANHSHLQRNTRLITPLLVSVAFLAALFPQSIWAADGVLEINQTCAVQTGCFPGDAAGFPVSITSPGSYRLTGNLTVADPNLDGIDIDTNTVSLSLSGFSIQGPGTSGTGTGVYQASARRLTRISNGTVIGFGESGVRVGRFSSISQIRVIDTGSHG
ncbi:MAG: hypothetical protein WBG86_09305, partial [Polyangiales bacterium]